MKTFGELYGDILTPFVKKYTKAKNEKGRKAVVKNATDAVLKTTELLEDGGGDLPNDLPMVGPSFFLLKFPPLISKAPGNYSFYQTPNSEGIQGIHR